MHLLLIRHGQTSLHKSEVLAGWTNDPGLDFDGQRQARELAEHISGFFPNYTLMQSTQAHFHEQNKQQRYSALFLLFPCL